MIAPSARTGVAVAAALALTGTAIAQQLTANQDTTDPARIAHIERDCGPIAQADLACAARSSIEFSRAQTALMKDRAEAARKDAAADREAAAAAKERIAKSDAAIAEHQKAAAAYRTEAQCLGAIADALTSKRITPADVRGARATPTPTTDACEVVRRLQPQLGELTKR